MNRQQSEFKRFVLPFSSLFQKLALLFANCFSLCHKFFPIERKDLFGWGIFLAELRKL